MNQYAEVKKQKNGSIENKNAIKDHAQGKVDNISKPSALPQISKKQKNQAGEVFFDPRYSMFAPKLLPGQWYSSDREILPASPYSSFWKAAVYNIKSLNYQVYDTIAKRQAFYEFADAFLNTMPRTIKSKFFAAAAMVTQKNALGAAGKDMPNLWFLSDETDKFLQEGNKFLFYHNMKNIKLLMEGKEIPGMENLRGQTLDERIVEFEQNKIEEFIETQINNPSLEKIISEINDAFKFEVVGIRFSPFLVQEVIEEFENQKIDFDFRNKKHRIMLGKKLIRKIYEKNKKSSRSKE